MAKETMQAVSEAEKNAQQIVLYAKEESEQLLNSAEKDAEKLISDAKKEAAKRVEILCGVARADGEKLKARSSQETEEQQAALKKSAEAAFPQAAEAIKAIVMGRKEV